MKEDYEKMLKSGMFWEFYPKLSGNWEEDQDVWTEKHLKRNQAIEFDDDKAVYPLTPDECRRMMPSIESQKLRLMRQVADYLNARFRGGIHLDSDRMLFEVLDSHESKDEIVKELRSIFKYKI